MKKNMGSIDRVVRLIIAITVAALYFTDVLTGVVGICLMVLAVIFLATSLISFCPIYAIFGMNTCPTNQAKS